jgi:hypothetical protein
MPTSRSTERREYAQLAMDCLQRMIEARSEAAHDREHKKALEWIRRADAVLNPISADRV